MRLPLGFAARSVLIAAAFGAPFGFVACDLSPLAVPGGTGGGATTTTSPGGSGGQGGGATTTTSPGGSGGQGGTGGATTSTTTGTAGSGGAGGSGGTGGSGGQGGATMTTTTSAGGSGGTGGVGVGGSGGAGGSGTGGAGGATMTTTSEGGAGGGTTTGMGGTGGATTTSTGEGGSMMDAGADDAGDAGDGGFPSLCGAVIATHPIVASPHVASCSSITYTTNPPTSGPHYPIWAAFKVYTAPVPRGFYVHSMEHGAVVVTYNCPAGCDADVAALVAYLDSRPADPLCVAPLENRFIVTPDPLLDVPFAASAWGASLKAQCFDLPALGAFIDAHYAKGPENFCFDGTDVTDPASGIPADCGSPADAGSD